MLAFQMTHNHADADEMSQRAFVKAFQHLDKFKGKSSFYTWLYRIATNECIEHLRRSKSHISLSQTASDDDSRPLELPSNEQLDGRMFEKETQQTVWRALNRLKAEVRSAVISVYIDGLTPKEASAVLGCAEATVHWRLFRARPILKRILKVQGAEV